MFRTNEPANRAAPTAQCVVHPPRPGDFEKMAVLAGQLGYPSSAAQIRERLREMQDSRQYAVFVAEMPEKIVAGWIGVFVFRAVELDKCAEISGLIVDEAIRSAGVGKALLDAVEAWSRGVGCAAISVHSNIKRLGAHDFYMRHGYEWVKTQAFLRKNLAS